MNQLVVSALQKGGINRHHRLDALTGQPGGKGHGVLLGNAHVKIAVGVLAGKTHHARAFAHGRGDAHQPAILLGHIAQPVAKHLGVAGLAAALAAGQAVFRAEARHAVVGNRVFFRQLVALALFGDHMQKLRALELAHIAQGVHQGVQVVAVDWAEIVKAKFFKQRAGGNHALDVFFSALDQRMHRRGHAQHLAGAFFHCGVKAPGHQLGQIVVERADIGRDRHIVVVEDHQQVSVHRPGVVQRFKGHAGGHRAVANHRHHLARLALGAGGGGHAQRRAN